MFSSISTNLSVIYLFFYECNKLILLTITKKEFKILSPLGRGAGSFVYVIESIKDKK